MFEPSKIPRVFGLPPGVDFPHAVVAGLLSQTSKYPPETIARVELFVNTRRMARRMTELFQQNPPGFLPRIRLITDLAKDLGFSHLPAAGDPLARRLELAQMVRALIAQQEDLASADAAFDLADSLATLMEEMHSEGVSADTIAGLDVSRHSAYWARSLQFLDLIRTHFSDADMPDSETRQRQVVFELVRNWTDNPPRHPVIVAGSTGSRGTTRYFMEAVAKLPQGAIILPGFDADMPQEVWDSFAPTPGARRHQTAQDHPQYRYYDLMARLSLTAKMIAPWGSTQPANCDRNRLISLALRPAPVTDAWLHEGPDLENLHSATAGLTLLEAPSSRIEAVAIALRLRQAVEEGIPAALITPDRMLTRQVTAALHRWGIEPDDSAGIPLGLSAPGRLLRQTAALMGRHAGSEDLLALLKHPLVCASLRGNHLRHTRDLELKLLRGGPPYPDRAILRDWAEKRDDHHELTPWIDWFCDCLEPLAQAGTAALGAHLAQHIALTERLAAGPEVVGADHVPAGALWDRKPGEAALESMDALRVAAPSGGSLSAAEYEDLITAILSRNQVRDPATPHPGVMIWGALEARVQGADLVIMAGLNDGTWPELPGADPWLNRDMRRAAGLLLPERNIGLAAHDFQQSIAGHEVWLTRARRDAEAETVPSRWLNRLRNLLEGLRPDGQAAYSAMQARGDDWLALVAEFERPESPVPPASRPAPQPPVDARPHRLSVTRIERLIRDPYAIYAAYVLGLRPLDPLSLSPDAALRGQVLHEVFERFVEQTKDGLPEDAYSQLLTLTDDLLAKHVPWPAARALWRARMERVAPWFLDGETLRRHDAAPALFEQTGRASIPSLGFDLNGRIDRIDRMPDGHLILYDYKTGVLPTEDQQTYFNKQLPLLAAMTERGGVGALGAIPVAQTRYIGLGSTPKQTRTLYAPGDLGQVWEELTELIAAYMRRDKGYAARRAVFEARWGQEYDHLARFGEWDQTDPVTPQKVGP